MKYHDGTLGLLDVKDRNIYQSSLIEGINQRLMSTTISSLVTQ